MKFSFYVLIDNGIYKFSPKPFICTKHNRYQWNVLWIIELLVGNSQKVWVSANQ